MLIEGDYFYTRLNFDDNLWLKHLNKLKEKSIHKANYIPNKKDEILILQTCSTTYKNNYIVISAYKIERENQ